MRFDQYLSAVETYLQPLPASVRQGEIQEMAGHLEQLHADFVAAGHSDEVAREMALARFSGARKTGLRLRDVWEGNKSAWLCFAAVALSNYALQFADAKLLLWFIFDVTLFNPALKEPFTPLMVCWAWWALWLMPFGLNFMLGRWGGRRVLGSIPAAYLPLLAVPVLTPIASNPIFVTMAGIELTFPYLILFFIVVATGGAWAGSFWRRRQRWALVGGTSLENASALLHQYQRGHWRRFGRRASTCVAVAGIIGFAGFALIKKRVNDVLHPPTPAAAVRVMLSDPGMNFNEMEPATNVSMRVLPATPKELKKGERRVSYTATMHATESYRQKRIAFLQKNLRASLAGDSNAYDVKSCRLSLARLKPVGYKISRVVRATKKAQGWKVGDGAKSTAYAWLYDVYYER